MAASFLKNLGMSRECLNFDTGTPKVDAAVVCHEVRCLDLRENERVCLSFRNLAKRGSEEFAAPNEVVSLMGVQLDSTVLVTVFAMCDDVSRAAVSEKRPLGEVRMPLHRVVTKCDGALYHTWLTLDTASLQDTASSITSLIAGGDGEAFDRAMLNGPRQMAQPKACLSICKTSILDSTGRVLFLADAPNDFRIANWGPLLRSQTQHVVMSAAYHLESVQQPAASANQGATADRLAKATARLQSLEDRDSENLSEIARLRAELVSFKERDARQVAEIQRLETDVARQDASVPQVAAAAASDFQLKAALEAQGAQIRDLKQMLSDSESDRQQAIAAAHARQEAEEADLRTELAKCTHEANQKIDAANERIRSLRRDRDEAHREAERVAAENHQLLQDKNALLLEKDQLSEQKEALLKIVEDLHQTCVSSGQQGLHGLSTRASIDSVTGLRLS